MEFSPDGVFDDRRSLVAYARQEPAAFKSRAEESGRILLDTGVMTVVTCENDKAFFPANLEVRWLHDGLLQYWRPGDRDYRNLGGTVRSLDRYGNTLAIEGVHPADMDSPDAKSLEWLAWLQCEDDPPYYEKSPDKRPGLNGDFHASVAYGLNNLLQRTYNRTVEGLKFAPGILSRSGYFLLNDSASPVMDDDDFPVERDRPGFQDFYFFAYGADYRAALRDFILLCGKPSLPARHAFGLMFCRWPAPDEREARKIVGEFIERGAPLSVMIIDMEWHKEGWGHWEWDPKFYPDPAGFFRWCHGQGLQVALNDHPLDVRSDDKHYRPYLEKAGTAARARPASYNKKRLEMIDVDICDKREARAFLEVCHSHIMDAGLDFWWNDGCKGRLNGAVNQLVCNKLMFEESRRDGRRGMLLARYGGLGSHRYGAFFTGDTLSCWEVLRTQCEFNIRAGHVGMGYVSHDIGGFFMPCPSPLMDPILYLRWLQFGVFSPVFRFHSAPGSGSRKPWDYGEDVGRMALRWLKARNSLIPYIYAAAREHYDAGVPLVRGIFFDRPLDEKAYVFDQYMFGPSILVAPILSAENHRTAYLPEGEWYKFETSERIAGGREIGVGAGMGDVPAYVRAGSVIVRQNPERPQGSGHVGELVLDIYPGPGGTCELYEDDGGSDRFEHGKYCRTRFELSRTDGKLSLSAAVTEGMPLGGKRKTSLIISSPDMPGKISFCGRKLKCQEAGKGLWRVELGNVPSLKKWEFECETGST